MGSEVHGGGAVYKSHDRGDRWSAANEGIESVAVFALAMDPNELSVLYVTGPEGTSKRRLRVASHASDGPHATASLSDDSLSVGLNLIMLLSDCSASRAAPRADRGETGGDDSLREAGSGERPRSADLHRPGTLYVSGPHGIFATTTGGR